MPNDSAGAYVNKRICSLHHAAQSGNKTAATSISKLKRAVGTEPGCDRVGAYAIAFDGAPSHLIGTGEEPSMEEWAVHISLTLWAMHQSAKPRLVHVRRSTANDTSLGAGAYRLAKATGKRLETGEMSRQMTALVSSSDIVDLEQNIRRLISQFRAHDIDCDYALLADQILAFAHEESRASVKRQWAREYVRAAHNQTKE